MASTKYQPVADFYTDKSVFITGGTGFLGKMIINKLLQSCTKLDRIYLLVREKKGVDVNARLQNIFENPLYTKLRETNAHSFDKVVPIHGDIVLPRLGLSQEDENTLIEKVSVVIHCAAVVKLNEPLKLAMNINFEGTQKVLSLCKRINNMQAFIYISTAYAHTNLPVISEVIYPAPAKLEEVYKFIKENGDNTEATIKFIGDRANTYTFSKALTESYVAENHGPVPTVIIRPSIVTSASEEPIQGWLDNWFGPTTIIYNAAKGWNHINLGSKDCIADLIPVDYVANLSIIAATKAQGSNEVQVFNSTSSGENPITWFDFQTFAIQEYVKKGYNELPFFTAIFYSRSRIIVYLLTIIMHIMPAYIADFWIQAKGKQPKYVKLISRVMYIRNSLDYFTSSSWKMQAEQTRKLFSKLSPEDQRIFPCDPVNISWPKYIKDYVNGIYQYLKS